MTQESVFELLNNIIFFLLLFFSPLAYLQSNQVMGWGEKAIELRSVETGNLEGVFMHKKAQKLKFLCERNDKVQMTTVWRFSQKMSNIYDTKTI